MGARVDASQRLQPAQPVVALALGGAEEEVARPQLVVQGAQRVGLRRVALARPARARSASAAPARTGRRGRRRCGRRRRRGPGSARAPSPARARPRARAASRRASGDPDRGQGDVVPAAPRTAASSVARMAGPAITSPTGSLDRTRTRLMRRGSRTPGFTGPGSTAEARARSRLHPSSAGAMVRRCTRWCSLPGRPLEARELPDPRPGEGDVLLRVRACGVCRTDLHLIDGEVPDPEPPRVLGHQIVGDVLGAARASRPAPASASPGWAGRTGPARLAPRAREPLPRRPVHRPRSRRRLRRAGRGRRALLLPDPRRIPGPPGRPAAVRRADRLPRPRLAGDGRATGTLRLRRGGAHHLPGRRHQGRTRLRLHPPRRRRRRRGSPAGWARRGRAARTRRPRSRSTPR